MADPIITPNSSPITPNILVSSTISSTVSSATAATGTSTTDSLSLYEFLQLVGTNQQNNRQATFENQATTSLVNQQYFLGVSQQLNVLEQKLKSTIAFQSEDAALITNYNASVVAMGGAIDTYNAALPTLNNEISMMNNAISTINSQHPPTAAQIAAYTTAATNYNNYLSATGNPALLQYAQDADTIYNQPTNTANTVTIPQINADNAKLGLNIPPQTPFTPATAPVGASALGIAPSYTGITIPLINPSSYSNLNNNLQQQPAPVGESQFISTYFTPFAQNYMADLAATQQKLSGFDTQVGDLNFYIKQGANSDPSKPNSFISNAPTPNVSGGATNGVGGSLSFSAGVDSSSAVKALSTAIFLALSKDSATPIPPAIYDQVNVLASSILPRIGLAAGLGTVQLLGDSLKSTSLDNSSISVALSAAVTQSTLQVVSNSTATRNAASTILQTIPGITDEEVQDLTTKLVAAQNISLLLFSALHAATTLQNPQLVQKLINATNAAPANLQALTTPAPNTTTVAPNTNNVNASNIASDQLNATILNQNIQTQNIINSNNNQTEIVDAEIVSQNQAQATATNGETGGTVADNAVAENNLDAQSDILINQNSAAILQAQNLATLVQNANISGTHVAPATSNTNTGSTNVASAPSGQGNTINPTIAQNTTPTFNAGGVPATPLLAAAQVNSQLQSNIQSVLPTNGTSLVSTALTNNWVNSLTDTGQPGSWVNLMNENVDSLRKANDQAVDEAIAAQQEVIANPDAQIAKILLSIQDPANNIIKSYLAGPMYSNAISAKWAQPPLSIQV